MNMTLAIILSALAIIAYSILDHIQDKKRNALATLAGRVDALEKRIVPCEKFIESEMGIGGKREDACSSVPLPGQSNDSDD